MNVDITGGNPDSVILSERSSRGRSARSAALHDRFRLLAADSSRLPLPCGKSERDVSGHWCDRPAVRRPRPAALGLLLGRDRTAVVAAMGLSFALSVAMVFEVARMPAGGWDTG